MDQNGNKIINEDWIEILIYAWVVFFLMTFISIGILACMIF